ncbi:ABC transporter family substrate-binding protein [Leucobacter sp. OH1287]|uniref:ABC transporter family substrate-binding protein n=1 Tax=Leucobacter sp. OH1287 TaxID=2491049 RepID=UPI000F5DB1AA|nr:ABC transporter family substrate-binding protein [Leucobacter sp. OH1287]RRD59772.1 ABC transporter family substrate-binding protein [Leucobacter sp. OH1287]
MTKARKITGVLAVGAASALVLSACSPEGPATSGGKDVGVAAGQQYTVEPTDSGYADLGDIKTADGEIRWGSGDNFTSYNNLHADNYSTYNSYVTDLTGLAFFYYGTDGTIYQNKDMGSYEKVSDDPFKVKYTIHKDATWSDGTPITVADYVFKWAVENPETKDAAGNTVFNPVSTSLGEQVTGGLEFENFDSKEFSITFNEPYADWELLMGGIMPSHIVAEQAGMSKEDLLTAAQNKDGEALKAAAEFWNTGWDVTTKLGDMALYPSYGPYKLKSFSPNQSVTLEANEKFWGTPPATKNITIRIADPSTHAQALQNRDLTAIEPQATVDTLNQLQGMGDSVIIHQYPTMTYEHLDFNFGGGVFAESKELREAFAYCVPRQQIVDNLIKPLNPDAEVLNSRGEFFNFQKEYKDYVSDIYDGKYDEVDIKKAKSLVEKSGVSKPKVRIGYNKPNPRRSDTVALIKESCDQAGFEIVDQGAENFFGPDGDLSAGNYDIALFAWAGSGQVVSGQNISSTDQPQNYGKYSNAEVDAAWKKVASSVDRDKQVDGRKEVEKLLWEDLFSLPIYAHPGIAANASDLANVRANSTQTGLVWNQHQWAFVNKAE